MCKRTGHVYERRLIEKFLDAEHKCPITGDPMDRSDLLEIKGYPCPLLQLFYP